MELQEYDFKLIHRSGTLNAKADILSRQADHERGENDNSNIILLKPEWFVNELLVEALDANIISHIKSSKNNKDRVVTKALANNEEDWEEQEDGMVVWQDLIYVPRNKKLREDIIKAHHDAPTSGHPGREKTRELITRNYWWPRMMWDIKSYVKGCDKCQRTKAHRNKPNAPLQPHDAPSKPWEVVSVDLIGELPESAGYNAICIFVDRFSKQIHAVPTNTSLTATGTAQLYRDHIFRLHGWPRKFIHDRGTQFESRFMKEFYKLLNIEGNPSTAYHPQTDGQTERINQEIKQYLRIFINFYQNNWSDWLALAEFSYNDKVHSATGYSPFFINHGYHPHDGVSPGRTAKNVAVDTFVTAMDKVRDEAKAALTKARDLMKRYYDQRQGKAMDYKAGDLVWLEKMNIGTSHPMKKLDNR